MNKKGRCLCALFSLLTIIFLIVFGVRINANSENNLTIMIKCNLEKKSVFKYTLKSSQGVINLAQIKQDSNDVIKSYKIEKKDRYKLVADDSNLELDTITVNGKIVDNANVYLNFNNEAVYKVEIKYKSPNQYSATEIDKYTIHLTPKEDS